MSSARVVVQTAPFEYEVRPMEVPPPTLDGAILRVEANAVCGTDVAVFAGVDTQARFPLMPGHEPVGRIEAIGQHASERWGLVEGDRVVVASSLSCGRCAACRGGGTCVLASGRVPNYGWRSPEEAPGLWGGLATHLYLPPQAYPLAARDDIATPLLALFNAVGNAWHWAVEVGGLGLGDVVVVFGPGPRGLALTALAAAAGAARVVVVGLRADADRLAVATALGATDIVSEQPELARAALVELLGEQRIDLVVDATSTGARLDAVLPMGRVGGRIVLGGLRGGSGHGIGPDGLANVVLREIRILGARSTPPSALRAALDQLSSGRIPWAAVGSEAVGLDGLGGVLRELACGDGASRRVHVHMVPSD